VYSNRTYNLYQKSIPMVRSGVITYTDQTCQR
jgi:hypothetical protein